MVNRRFQLVLVAALALTSSVAAAPEAVLAACVPTGATRAPGGAGWQSGAYKFGIEPWGVHADLEGYDPFVPTLTSGANSIVTIMMAESGHSWWIQPGWWKIRNMSQYGWPSAGYYSAVQFFDASGNGTDFFGRDFFVGSIDPVPDPGTLARYAMSTSFDGGSGKFQIDVKLAGLDGVFYKTAVQYDNVEIFGEINNAAAQFPGGVNDHVRLRTVGWRNPNLVWHTVDDTTPSTQPELGWSHTAGTSSYDIWDKACAS